jgi:hypothetical protein
MYTAGCGGVHLGRQRRDDLKFKARLDYIVKLCLKIKTKSQKSMYTMCNDHIKVIGIPITSDFYFFLLRTFKTPRIFF